MSALSALLDTYRDLYDQVWTYADWAKEQGLDGRDTGIDLVARTKGTGEYHAIQCKLYAEDCQIQKKDVDRSSAPSGKPPMSNQRSAMCHRGSWHAPD